MRMKFFLTIGILLTVLMKGTAQVARPSKEHGCRFWSSLAYNLTRIHEQVGDMLHMVCKNDNNTDGGGCQEMKCGGQFKEPLPISEKEVVNFNFCFGFRLNHCDDPVSMSYFFVVPSKNVSLGGKLTHDDNYEIPGGNFQGVDTTVIVSIRMEPKGDKHIEFGIKGEVRAELLGSPIFDPKMDVFPPTLIDVIPCDKANKNKNQDPAFTPLTQCGLPANYTVLPTNPATKRPVIQSKTFNKSCELGLLSCSTNEVCQSTGSILSRSGVCKCVPFHVVNPTTGFCGTPLNPTTPKGSGVSQTTGYPSVTQASKSKEGGISVVAIAVPSVVGGLLVIVVIVSIIIYIGKRKRSAIYRDRHQLLTTDDEDDVNLVI